MSDDPDLKKLRYAAPAKGMPSELWIGGQRWKVRYPKNLLATGSLMGAVIYLRRLIIVDASMDLEAQRTTLLHEVLHACLSIAPHHGLSHGANERVVAALEPVMLAMLRDNARWW